MKQKADLDEFDPCQFDIDFSDESDKSMVLSVKEPNPAKADDKSMVMQLEAIANLMKRIETNLSNKDKVLGSTVSRSNPDGHTGKTQNSVRKPVVWLRYEAKKSSF